MIRRAALAAAALATLAGCPAPPSRLVKPAPPTARAPGPAPAPPLAPPPAVEPAPAAVHVVRPGDTIYRIARDQGITPAALMAANGISDPRELKVGTRLVLPSAPDASGAKASPPAAGAGAAARASAAAALGAAPPAAPPAGEERAEAPARLAWPLHGVLYGRFGVRAGERHDGIDIAAPEGTEVTAAADGTVIYAGEQPAYGAVVILRHEDGLVTLYAHNSAVLVREGARVARGEPIARVGQTGRTTGPHLHFEVRQGTRPRNPLLFLP